MVVSTIKNVEINTSLDEHDNFKEDDSVCCGCCDELVQALSVAWSDLKVGFNKLFSFTKPAQPDLQTTPVREHGKADLLDKLRSINKEIQLTSRELSKLR